MMADQKMGLMDILPWSVVFEFLGGDDVARALMASKHQNPWKTTNTNTSNTCSSSLLPNNKNDLQQCNIIPALKARLMTTEKGNELLELYERDNLAEKCMPKLLYCMDNRLHIRYDGYYMANSAKDSIKMYYRFYPTGDVISLCSIHVMTPENVGRKLCKENEQCSRGEFQLCNLISKGKELWAIQFCQKASVYMCDFSGTMRNDGALYLDWGSGRSPMTFEFVQATFVQQTDTR